MSKKIISAKIPEELYNQIIQSKYKTNTDCITAALNLLFLNTHQDNETVNNRNTDYDNVLHDNIKVLQSNIDQLKEQITIKDSQIEKLQITQQTLVTKLDSKPLMIDQPGHLNKWWQFWK